MIRSLLIGLSLLSSAAALAADAGIDAAKSSVTATFTQLGVPVEAQFHTFHGQIAFDPAAPAAAKAQVEIAVNSFDLGDPEYNSEVLKPDWFDAAHFPTASFVADTIKATAAGKLEARGKLTIKGRSEVVTVPISYRQEGARQIFEGALPIKRLTFGIGEGEWRDTDVLADQVLVKFKMVTTAP